MSNRLAKGHAICSCDRTIAEERTITGRLDLAVQSNVMELYQ
jgi:hypothetical protein